MSKIAIIIPCYNTSDYIERCLNALEEQTFKDFEVIMIDDCSTDNTIDVIEKKSKHTSFSVTLLKNEKNSGPAVSRNKGICYAESDFITFCDCDDWYDPDFLSVMHRKMMENDANLVFCGYKVVNEAKKVELRSLVESDSLCSISEALRLDADSLCMMMVRTSIMKTTLLPNIRNGEDMAVTPLLIEKAGGCVAISDTLYNYFRRDNSASQSPTMQVVDSLVESFKYINSNTLGGFNKEIEFIGIRNLLYSGLITLMSFSNDKKRGNEIIDWFETQFPNWWDNSYMKDLPNYKRTFLKCVHLRLYIGMRIIAKIRKIVTRG